MPSRKLVHYFQAHPITIVVPSGVAEIITNQETTGRIVAIAMELQPYGLTYASRNTIKSEALAGFFGQTNGGPTPPVITNIEHKTLLLHGSKRFEGGGVVLISPM